MGNRIIRGFSRLGIATAVLVALCGALVTTALAGDPHANPGAILGITGLLALAAWGFFRGLGWVLAGFAPN
jgi:hypothetical protein